MLGKLLTWIQVRVSESGGAGPFSFRFVSLVGGSGCGGLGMGP